jgi:hypothetical protein
LLKGDVPPPADTFINLLNMRNNTSHL